MTITLKENVTLHVSPYSLLFHWCYTDLVHSKEFELDQIFKYIAVVWTGIGINFTMVADKELKNVNSYCTCTLHSRYDFLFLSATWAAINTHIVGCTCYLRWYEIYKLIAICIQGFMDECSYKS